MSEVRFGTESMMGTGYRMGLHDALGNTQRLGTSMLGDDIPTHFIPAIGMTVSGEIGSALWDRSIEDISFNGLGRGYAIGLEEQIGEFSTVSYTYQAYGPTVSKSEAEASTWVNPDDGVRVDMYGNGFQYGQGYEFGEIETDDRLSVATGGSAGLTKYRGEIGSALWDRSIEDISFDGLGRGYAIGLGEQIGEFSTVSYTYQAYGPTGVRTIGDARRIFRFWAINAQYPIPATEEVRTYDQLSLTMRAKKSQVVDVLRPLFDASSGEVDVIEKSGGSYESFDTSQSGNEFTITPAHRQRPTRVPRNYLVDKYDEQIVDQKGDEYQVSVDFVPEKTREPDEEYEGREESDHEFVFQKREPEQWQFVMHSGTIATKSITKDIKRGKDGVNLRMVMKPKQTQIFEESASYVEGITGREIPDGDNKWDDESPGSRNTTYIVPPEASAGVFDEGNYRITKWTTTRINNESYEINASFVRSEDPGQTTKTSAAPGEASLVEMGQTTDAEATTGEGSLVE